jgi:hypothetical protein
MNTLLEASTRMPFHTDLRLVFEAFGGRAREFNWLLTDIELNVYPPGLAYSGVGDRNTARWRSGSELSDIVTTQEIRFVWGVLSGFRPGVTIDPAALDVHPFADGNRSFWAPGARIQHPLADVEIVCWDAGATVLLSHDDDLTRRFRSFFPEAVDLDEYNRRMASGRTPSDAGDR